MCVCVCARRLCACICVFLCVLGVGALYMLYIALSLDKARPIILYGEVSSSWLDVNYLLMHVNTCTHVYHYTHITYHTCTCIFTHNTHTRTYTKHTLHTHTMDSIPPPPPPTLAFRIGLEVDSTPSPRFLYAHARIQ